MCDLGWPQTDRGPCASVSQMLRFKEGITTTSLKSPLILSFSKLYLTLSKATPTQTVCSFLMLKVCFLCYSRLIGSIIDRCIVAGMQFTLTTLKHGHLNDLKCLHLPFLMNLGRADWIIAHHSKNMFLVLRSVHYLR